MCQPSAQCCNTAGLSKQANKFICWCLCYLCVTVQHQVIATALATCCNAELGFLQAFALSSALRHSFTLHQASIFLQGQPLGLGKADRWRRWLMRSWQTWRTCQMPARERRSPARRPQMSRRATDCAWLNPCSLLSLLAVASAIERRFLPLQAAAQVIFSQKGACLPCCCS